MKGFILHQFNPPCRAVDDNERLPCTLTGQEDYQRLMSVNSANPSPPGRLNIGCKDGSNNMTCLPLSLKPVRYFCACAAEKGELNTGIRWNDNWEDVTESGFTTIKHSLCDTQAGWCLDGMFRMFEEDLVNLVELYAPLDSQISVSSIFDQQYTKEKIRLDYNGNLCGWIRGRGDNAPWVKFDLSQIRVAVGVKIGKQCDSTGNHVTSFHVSSSSDEFTWSSVGTDVQAVYESIIFTWWFDMEISARYWAIIPRTWTAFPAMQADILGYI